MLPQVIPVLALDGRFIGNIVNELPGRVPLSSGQRGAGVAPARTATSPSALGTASADDCGGEALNLSPKRLAAAFSRSFHSSTNN